MRATWRPARRLPTAVPEADPVQYILIPAAVQYNELKKKHVYARLGGALSEVFAANFGQACSG